MLQSGERPFRQTSVLVVDPELPARSLCLRVLKGLGLEAQGAETGAQALASLESSLFDIVVVDVGIPCLNGPDLLKTLEQNFPEIDIVMTGSEAAPPRVQSLKLRVFDYLPKPFRAEDLQRYFRQISEKKELAAENRLLREELQTRHGFGALIGNSARMQNIYRVILRVAGKRDPVLIQGESGTGKELVARAIHTYSSWREKPFVPVDCAGLTPTLIESELFGHVRGAFTGATRTRPGLLATAQGGTVFLDEVAELPVELQVKLLRALQEREFKPLGSNERSRLDARIVAATNQDLDGAIRRGTFRKDLYFRLNVVSIKLPPLRERKADIPALVHSFVDRHSGGEGGITAISDEAMTRLMNYEWPGNVRELENCIQRALALSSGPVIQVIDLPSNVLYSVRSEAESEKTTPLRVLIKRAIVQALEAAGGDRVRAAKLLGIGKTTIYRKIKEYGLEGSPGSPPK